MRVILSSAISTHCTAAVDPNEPEAPDFTQWHPERLWLSRNVWHRAAHGPMHDALCAAVTERIADQTTDHAMVALQHDLLQRRRYGSALRVAARLLRGSRATATPVGRDLAACALTLAALRHDDLLAAIELAAEASGRALVVHDEDDGRPLPPGIRDTCHLAGRMQAQGRDVLGYRCTWPDLDSIGPSLARALDVDPVAALLGYAGRQVRTPDPVQ